MTPDEMSDLITLQKRLGEEWEHGCSNGRVYLTPKLVMHIFEFYAYLRSQYEGEDFEQQSTERVLVANHRGDLHEYHWVYRQSGDSTGPGDKGNV